MARALGSYPKGRGFKSNFRYHDNFVVMLGPVVKRLRHRPFTAVTRVRFPSGSPKIKEQIREYLLFYFFLCLQKWESKKAAMNDSLNGCQNRALGGHRARRPIRPDHRAQACMELPKVYFLRLNSIRDCVAIPCKASP